MLAALEEDAGNHKKSARILMKAVGRNVRNLSEVVGPLTASMLSMDATDELEEFLQQANARKASTSAALQSAEMFKMRAGAPDATSYLVELLKRHPTLRGLTGLSALIVETSEGAQKEWMTVLHNLLKQISESNPLYHCEGCGFTAKRLFWLCPGCQQWGLVVPITGPDGD